MDEELVREIGKTMFRDNKSLLVSHQLESYNDFVNSGIQRVFKERNPIKIMKEQDNTTSIFQKRCNVFMGGKTGSKVYFGRPVIADDDKDRYLYPNVARLRNMSYSTTIHVDVEVDFYIATGDNPAPVTPTDTLLIPRVLLGRFPIMLMSDLCILKHLPPDIRFELGECRNEQGGYFVVDGSEKVIISQEKFADNMLYIRKMSGDKYTFAADVRSVSENASKPTRVLSARIVAPSTRLKNGQIVVNIANVRQPVPLFIVMRALGILSDRAIIEHCLLDMDKYASYIDIFTPSVHDAGPIFTQELALKYIASLTKYKTLAHAMELMSDYFLAHIGELNFLDKAYYLGHMVRQLISISVGDKHPTDRDSFLYKRVELPGELLTALFKEQLGLQYKNIYQRIDKEYTYKTGLYRDNFRNLIEGNTTMLFADRIVERGFLKAFKGNWGATAATKRMGIVQTLNRLSFNSALSHLRKLNLTFDAGAKITGPRLLHSSQWGLVDPIDTPDGGNVGLHKHLAIATRVSVFCSPAALIEWAATNGMTDLREKTPIDLAHTVKLLINGAWRGSVADPISFVSRFKVARRNGMMPALVSIAWNIEDNSIFIYTDGGRLCRPVFWYDRTRPGGIASADVATRLKDGKFTWHQLVNGFGEKEYCPTACDVREIEEKSMQTLYRTEGIIDMIDTNEEETALVGFADDVNGDKPITNIEIDPSFLLGVMGNQVVFPENNPLSRNLFACGQMKQAVSLYHSNYQHRIDKMGVVLNYGQTPLVKSRYLKIISNEQHPYGENVLCAIMCFGGYNVEDSILFNQGSVDRGLFRTTYFNSYETREDSSAISGSGTDSRITQVDATNVIGMKQGFDYGQLGKNGLVREGTPLTDKTILIGKTVVSSEDKSISTDASIAPKKGQSGYVDRAYITEGEEGYRLAKVRVRDERIPSIGDKLCSRCGQKGTIGLVIPEQNMPYTAAGIRPDIIINPHALPSRMTIGQLVETLMGKACSILGGFGDCTAFANKGQKVTRFGEILSNLGYASSGNEILYNGETGEALSASIFMGPTYYMRLKHMVKDKINYRAKGPRTMLTRQTVQGRANDGGLRLGEMEKDAIAAHGAMHFLQESMLVRGDEYFMAICNKSGMTAIYNEAYNLFLSPVADGPVRFAGTVEGGLNIVNVSRYGRSFSVIRIPYAFKLLMQELATMNVQLRLITEDNIDQLEALAGPAVDFAVSAGPSSLPLGWEELEVDGEKTYRSLIRDADAAPTEIVKEMPTAFPTGWVVKDIEDYADGKPEDVDTALKNTPTANNWDTVLARLGTKESVTDDTGVDAISEGFSKLYNSVTRAARTAAEPLTGTTLPATSPTHGPGDALEQVQVQQAKEVTAITPMSMQPTPVIPGTAQPTTVLPGTAQPTMVMPGTAQPTMVMPGTAQPTTVLPGTAQPTMVMPGTAQPTMVMPGTAQPTMVMPGTAQPTMVMPGTAQPTMVMPGTVQATMATPIMMMTPAVQAAPTPTVIAPPEIQPKSIQLPTVGLDPPDPETEDGTQESVASEKKVVKISAKALTPKND